MTGETVWRELRCQQCGRLLGRLARGRGLLPALEIKCGRCKAIQRFGRVE